MVDPTAPTRKEIERISTDENGNVNFRVVKALERLFEVAGSETPADIITVLIDSATANGKANEAIAAVNRLANAIELSSLAPARELGTISVQNKDLIDIDGGTIDDVFITGGNADEVTMSDDTITSSEFNDGLLDNDTITNSTWTGGSITSNITDNQTTLIASSSTLGNGAGAGAGTLTNAPTAGDPTKWVSINDNGTTRYIPTWT